jgi:predicted phosphate transport protein (TIGR00153 family)
MDEQAETAYLGSVALHDLLKDFNHIEDKIKKIKELEHKGDSLMRDVYAALNKTFIVPIDHQDISTLASALDNVLDLVDSSTRLLLAYDIKEPTPEMIELVGILVEQTKELKGAVAAITTTKTYAKVEQHCNKIKQLEIKADEVYLNAITILFRKDEPVSIIKQKEILEYLESATDQADKASQIISDIVMKHA